MWALVDDDSHNSSFVVPLIGLSRFIPTLYPISAAWALVSDEMSNATSAFVNPINEIVIRRMIIDFFILFWFLVFDDDGLGDVFSLGRM